MSARPQNIGIKAIEVYFPSQVGVLCPIELMFLIMNTADILYSALTRLSWKSTMA